MAGCPWRGGRARRSCSTALRLFVRAAPGAVARRAPWRTSRAKSSFLAVTASAVSSNDCLVWGPRGRARLRSTRRRGRARARPRSTRRRGGARPRRRVRARVVDKRDPVQPRQRGEDAARCGDNHVVVVVVCRRRRPQSRPPRSPTRLTASAPRPCGGGGSTAAQPQRSPRQHSEEQRRNRRQQQGGSSRKKSSSKGGSISKVGAAGGASWSRARGAARRARRARASG
jgi:hypothetical protein